MTKIPHGKIPGDSAEDFKRMYGPRVVTQQRKATHKPVAKKKTRKAIAGKR